MKIEFNDQQLLVLDSALSELPYRVAAPLIQHINHQIHEQMSLDSDKIINDSHKPKSNPKIP
jgi:hypothetical protein